MKKWEVIVIGGGPAGSAAAIRLAQKERRVLLLEKEPAAHDKVCGEFISIEARHYLEKLGIDLAGLGAEPVSHIRLVHGRKTAAARLPFLGLSLSRRKLDEAMLSHAQASGADVRRGITVADITHEASGWRVGCAGGDVFGADTVFLATGKHDLRGWQRNGGAQNDFIGFKMHFKLAPRQKEELAGHVEMTLFDGGYAGLEPVEDGKANLCLVVAKSRFATHGKNWDRLMDAISNEAPRFAERLAGAERCWPRPLAVFGIPYGFVHHDASNAPPQLYRLGDQMAVIPSFSGNGMAIALHTAFLGAESYLRCEDAGAYHRRARTAFLPQVRRAAWFSQMGEFPWAQKLIVSACEFSPKLMAAIATGTRITKLVG